MTMMRAACGMLALACSLALLPPSSARADGAATSNDVERVARLAAQEQQALRERVRDLEAKVAQLTSTMGDRRGGERVDTVSEDIREIKRRLDRVERDVSRMQQSVSRLENKR